MDDPAHIRDQFLQVRRIIAAIASENGEFDEPERQLLASAIAAEYQLPGDLLAALLEDAARTPPVEHLVTEVTDPHFMRYLLRDLMVLALTKLDWDEAELAAAYRAIDALHLPQEAVANLRQAFDLILESMSALGVR